MPTGRLGAFGQQHGFAIYLQSGGVDTVQPLDGQGVPLSFRLAPWDVELAFRPLDFIQVNAKLNEQMIAHALDLLDGQRTSACSTCSAAWATSPCRWRAACAKWSAWKARPGWWRVRVRTPSATAWPTRSSSAADLTQDQRSTPWMRQGFDKLLLDRRARARSKCCSSCR
jgi:23S rRNA (uracil1939-C5)-methyltransferase